MNFWRLKRNSDWELSSSSSWNSCTTSTIICTIERQFNGANCTIETWLNDPRSPSYSVQKILHNGRPLVSTKHVATWTVPFSFPRVLLIIVHLMDYAIHHQNACTGQWLATIIGRCWFCRQSPVPSLLLLYIVCANPHIMMTSIKGWPMSP